MTGDTGAQSVSDMVRPDIDVVDVSGTRPAAQGVE